MAWVFITSKRNAKTAKEFIERKGYYDKERKVSKLSEEEVMIPIKRELAEEIQQKQIKGVNTASFLFSMKGKIQYINDEDIIRCRFSPQHKLGFAIGKFLKKKDANLDEIMYKDLPSHWEHHGDLVLLPEKSFTLDRWKAFGDELWQVVAKTLGAARIAKKSTICRDGFRTPQVCLLLGDSGWVMHIDNSIKYTFDVTKCMFSAGNITEKIRVGSFDCKGQTVVDLYAGIGYFVLPYLIHSRAAMVYACEWNENAIEALRRNLKINNVNEQCVIYEGDNQKFPLQEVADRVNLGLIPSSEAGWPVACAALRSDKGGWLHIHGNVTSGLTNTKVDSPSSTQIYIFSTKEEEESRLNSHSSSLDNLAVVDDRATSDSNSTANGKSSDLNGDNTLKAQESVNSLFSVHSSKMSRRCYHSLCVTSNLPSCNKRIKPEWLDWAKYVGQSLLVYLKNSHNTEISWNVQIHHIEHVKSYAPHIDHIVLDVECCPLHESVKHNVITE